jgi:tetratricopeptide (TPR) repeat protein
MQALLQQQFEPLVDLKLSIARRAGSMRNFHFGNIRHIDGGSIGEYALHIQCPWRIESAAGIVTGSQDLWQWAFAEHEPLGWDYEDGNSLQDVRLGELLKGYDNRTSSYVNTTDELVVENIQVTLYGDVTLFLSGGYRLTLFPASLFGEAWRLLRPGDDTTSHFVLGEDFVSNLPIMLAESGIFSLVSHHQAALCYERGRTLKTQDDLTTATDQLSQAIVLNPNFAAAYFERAGVYQTLDEPERALADVNEAIRLYQEHHHEFYEIFCLRGRIRIDLEDFAGAILDLTRALSLSPKGRLAHFLRAMARELNDDLVSAIDDYSEVIRLRPHDAVAFDSRGDLYRRQGHLEQALADFSEAIQINPSEWLFHYHRGLVWATKGDIQGAIGDYRQALTLFADNQSQDTKLEMLDFIAAHPNVP